MPSRYTIRQYQENAYYHIYNRGVEKRIIFQDEQDYRIFLFYLFVYLAPIEIVKRSYPKINGNLINHNLFGQIEILAYCLMPNHFHLLVRQTTLDATTKLLRQLMNAYTYYFNKKNHRVGGLMQGKYQSILVETDAYLLELSKYIHRNSLPLLNQYGGQLQNFPWSSYPTYLRGTADYIVNPTFIGSYFSTTNPSLSYKNFVEQNEEMSLPTEYLLDNDLI